MKNGFESYKDLLDVIVIPVFLALLAIVYPKIQSWYIKRRFKELIFRELVEISPYPENAEKGRNWNIHKKKRCIHKEIFDKASENRDFILTLEPDLVYYLSNLWQENQTDEQWLHYLCKLKRFFGNRESKEGKTLNTVYGKWVRVIRAYSPNVKIPCDCPVTLVSNELVNVRSFVGQLPGDKMLAPEGKPQPNKNEGEKVEAT